MKRLSLVLVVFLFAACGDPDPKPANNQNLNSQNSQNSQNGLPECSLDTDCAADQACDNGSCVPTCVTDADCSADQVCDNSFCIPAIANNNTNNTNNNNNTNNAFAYAYFMVEDTTQEGCDTLDPGSDFQYVAIQDTVGSALGYAEATFIEFGAGENDFVDTSILDGNPPDFAGDCTDDFNDTSVFALGCGGRMMLRAIDGTGTPFQVASGEHQIEFSEYGAQCRGSMDDTYVVWGCTDAATAANGIFDSCAVLWGENLSGAAILGPLEP